MAMTAKERMQKMREQKKIIKLESDFENLQTVVYGKPMPNSFDLEEVILGSIMLDMNAMEKVLKIFQDKNPFYNEKHAIVYDCMVVIFKKKFLHPDRKLVYEEFLLMDEVTQKHIDLNPYDLIVMTETISNTVNLEKHCQVVLDMVICRELIHKMNEITVLAYERKTTDCLELLNNYHIGITEASKIDFVAHTPKQFCPLFPRNRISMLFAPPKAGKTGVIFSIMDALSGFQKVDGIAIENTFNFFYFPNEMERRAKVLYFDGEMHDEDYKERGILQSEIIRCPVREINSLKSEILYHKPDFTIIDTISKYVPNLLDTRAIKTFLDTLFEMRHLTAFVIIAHTPKSEFGKKLSEASVFGSVMQIAAIENLMSVNYINGIRYLKQHLSRTKPVFKENEVLLLTKQNNFTFSAEGIIDERHLFYDIKEYKHLLADYRKFKVYKSKYEFAKEYGIKSLEDLNHIFKIAKEVDFHPEYSKIFKFDEDAEYCIFNRPQIADTSI